MYSSRTLCGHCKLECKSHHRMLKFALWITNPAMHSHRYTNFLPQNMQTRSQVDWLRHWQFRSLLHRHVKQAQPKLVWPSNYLFQWLHLTDLNPGGAQAGHRLLVSRWTEWWKSLCRSDICRLSGGSSVCAEDLKKFRCIKLAEKRLKHGTDRRRKDCRLGHRQQYHDQVRKPACEGTSAKII